MPMGILFWVLMIVWLVFGWWGAYPIASSALLFVLLGLLGWKTFGAPLQ